MNFSAVILAGGQSRRMGRDKAWLPLDGRPMLARQIELGREIACSEVFISGRADADYASFGCPALTDRFADAGPLAGIECALDRASAPLVLVLAVDLPRMTSLLLRRLLAECSPGTGVVPRINRNFEPLAALYPKAAQSIAVDLLQSGVRAVHQFARQCQEAGLVRFLDLETEALPCFSNWNRPEDILADIIPARS
jgi:molybdopterin-guanine dinucleotide biosynthesis protein A